MLLFLLMNIHLHRAIKFREHKPKTKKLVLLRKKDFSSLLMHI